MKEGQAGYRVFVSHSMRPDDLKVVHAAAEQLLASGIQCYLAERDPQPGTHLPDKVSQAIVDSDCLVAFLTQGGSASAFVNQEVGFALGRGKAVIPVVEKGLLASALLAGAEFIEFDRTDPQPAIQRLSAYLSGQHAHQQQLRAIEAERSLGAAEKRATTAEAIAIAAILVLVIVGLLVLASSSDS
jgi:hypothetical protein